MTDEVVVMVAKESDFSSINNFLLTDALVHRHLDWRKPSDWLGNQPFLLLKQNNFILAVLACPENPEGIAWIRLFASSKLFPSNQAWGYLYTATRGYYQNNRTKIMLAAVAIDEWFMEVLINSGFQKLQDIIIMERILSPLKMKLAYHSAVEIRCMDGSDLPSVEIVDHSAFSHLWQLNLDGLSAALSQSDYATVALIDNEIVGYQTSTTNLENIHLARIGVRKDHQRKYIGSTLLEDVMNHFAGLGYLCMTLNTQDDNYSSISLYQKYEFQLAGEKYPVLIKNMGFD